MMKKTVLAVAAVASLGMANTVLAATEEVGQAIFQWVGTVPAPSEARPGYWIVSADGGSVLSATDGVMVFDNKAGEVVLTSASTFGFKVVRDAELADGAFNPALDKEGVPYKATLGSIKAGKGGLVSAGGDHGYFAVTSGTTALSTSTPLNFAANQVATISLAPATPGSTFDMASANDIWAVQASLALTTDTAL
ncbi:hypothetical protein OA39_02254 [Vibrio campbellii]|uniref:MatB fimbrillin n=2 Tax=Vibrio campbellii TaxID=680 RepID=A0AAQ3AXE8_9VIBR|nr:MULTISPECIES: hypothetical protein [Vibrio]KGR35319.1 hypothetical protein OA39_02254 [Vibrio campbellii]OQQ04004.1 hypothetical protein BK412_10260 [Vibrio campbellii]WDG07094.1 hypothetical protein PUN50_10065 [Vibrio campbellii]CAD7810171.1 hypothetical protein ACOMICROBIO_LMKGKHOH_02732 [Vibrio sp. B1FIG11]CAE6911307.1 hypothetical protein ACOMICROBIO_LMKGKHOH_02732 [Vibrio sp. B1FIG11]